MNLNNKHKIEIKQLAYAILFLSVFVFGYYIRLTFLPEKLAKINILGVAGIFILYASSVANNKKDQILSIICGMFIISMIGFFFAAQYKNNRSFMTSLMYLFNVIIPLFCINLKIEDRYKKKIYKQFIGIFDFLVIIMFLMLIVDIVTGNMLISKFADITGDRSFIMFSSSRATRKSSIMGHYLPTAEIYIIFYVVHYLYKKESGNVRYFISMIISIIGVSMAASKSGIVLLLGLIIVFNINDIRILIVSLTAVGVAYRMGIFDTVIDRLFSGDSLTSGRDEVWKYLNIKYDDLMPVFIGHGSESTHRLNDIIPWASAAFEYPFRAFIYEFGIIFTVILYIVSYIIPVLSLLRKRKIAQIISLSAVFVYINTFNGIVIACDYMYIYAIVAFMIINSDYNDNFIERFLYQKKRR